MKSLKSIKNWLTRNTVRNKKTTSYEYFPSNDLYKQIKEERKKLVDKYLPKTKKNIAAGYFVDSSTKNYVTSSTVIANNSISTAAIKINGDPINGSMQVDVPIIVNGRDILKEIDEMRDALLLLKRDADMEKKYPRLKEIKDQYEKELEKYKTFERLK